MLGMHKSKWEANAALAPPWLFTMGATHVLRNSSGKTNNHMLSHGKSNNLLLQKKIYMVYIYLQKCLVYLCKAELDREKCTILFLRGWRQKEAMSC